MGFTDPPRHEDTIVAPATPPGRGALAVVRLSGPGTFPALATLFRPAGRARLSPRRAVVGRLVDPADGRPIDQVVVTPYRAPRSYTGQDMAEISAHGSPVLVREILRVFLDAGARLAEPGEFSLRAFLAGKMDLTQAEAVHDVVAARTLHQARVAERQLAGSIARLFRPLKDELLDLVAALETALEFAEDTVDGHPGIDAFRRLGRIGERLDTLAGGFRYGRMLQHGFALAVTGGPNVGKSSLFNRLIGAERAIVTEIPGTTRDVLREPAEIAGLPVTIVDTAGLRQSDDRIEQLGMERSAAAAADADVVLHVIDASRPWDDTEAARLAALRPHGALVALNKSDLPARVTPTDILRQCPGVPMAVVSALTGSGIEELIRGVARLAAPETGDPGDDAVIVSLRQQTCVAECRRVVAAALAAVGAGESEEFVLFHLRRALEQLDALTGATPVDAILGRIFSTFCIGK